MLNSVLVKKGLSRIQRIKKVIAEWMEVNEYESVLQLQESLSQHNTP